ncbi:MAG: putative DNA binding domain-containing protein [Desulfovibrio sp.]|jgi:ATP-dependent DNA helicase RecG|nr:putative DNA binding domain-containing protein [Desulfovibrio sp.]
MRTKIITDAEALALCEKAEDHFFDRKSASIDGKGVQKIVVAFANADGGDVYIGISDGKHEPNAANRWEGVRLIEEYNQHIQAISEISPTVAAEISFIKTQNRPTYILHISIEKSQSVHKTAAGSIYERKGAQSLPVKDPQKITELAFAKGAQSYEEYTIDKGTAEDIVDAKEIEVFLSEFSPSTDPLDIALNKHLIDRSSFKPKVAGILLFANEPASIMTKKCSVKIARYTTKEDDPERDHLGTIETLEGPLYPLIRQTVKRTTDTMSSINVWTADGPKAMEYPPETLWEIVVNAFIHRDYSISDDVQIKIFDNRIEVISPGRLPAFVTSENILDVRYARNPKIVNILSKYKTPPNKDIGEGLNTAFQKMKEWKLQSPEIIDEVNYVRVVIPHASLATPQDAIIEFIEKHRTITNRQAREITGIKSENAVKSVFYKLQSAGLIEMIPELKGNKAAWRKPIQT